MEDLAISDLAQYTTNVIGVLALNYREIPTRFKEFSSIINLIINNFVAK